MSDITNVLAIAAGAVPGAISRYQITEWTKTKFGTKFPYGTFVINLTGCLAMGFFFTISKGITGYPKELDLLIRTGFLGSYTTFSTYGFDTLSLWRNKETFPTAFYWAGSAILGLGAVMVGVALANIVVVPTS
ncbi:fluoride efflux transporter CrcB [Planktothrix paucivesiculata]|uniref:Fluoride-specific ion channel FluC n=1 Tax=Planktothrix paucivesiculata PCC 9631 TaxID=671071 RepID=A0A7Z9BQU1_9CYAN|nr:fluoride efflux transporter CrcB [Planktothrix paucivesiculata]VXD17825.1 Protein CrcB homolog [Planktothrix paucivesiculata PCC 9631]